MWLCSARLRDLSSLLGRARGWCPALGFVLAVSRPAQADEQHETAAPRREPPPATKPNVGSKVQPTVTAATVPLIWNVWPLFDPYASRRENAYAFGLDTSVPVRSTEQHPGWSLSVGQSMTTLRTHMWVRLQRDFVFRVSAPSSFALELSSYRFLAGLRALGLEVGPSVGLVPLALDLTDGRFGVSGLSPNAGLEFSFKIGVVRTAISAYEQFVWHWLGSDSSWMHGLSLQLSLEQARVLKRKEHPLILKY